MTRIAFLGTGLLGSAFVEAAARRGEQITVWNRTMEKALALQSLGVHVASTPAEAVRDAESVHLVLKDDEVVEEIVGQLRSGLGRDAIILDHTTTQPARTADRSRRLNSEGVRYLHCPVFIGPAAARAAKGTILVAGPRTLYDARESELARMATRVEFVGERPDLAAVYKLCGNAFIIGISALAADVFTIAASAKVPAEDALRILDLFDPNSVIAARGKNIATGNFTPSFELSMARKDVRLMLETTAAAPLAALPGIAARMDELIDEGHGDEDLSVLGVDVAAGRHAGV